MGKLIRFNDSIINMDNIYQITLEENKLIFYGNCDRRTEVFHNDEEEARKVFERIFEGIM